MTYGYTGKILRVNLTDRTWQEENISETMTRRYMGGEGFIAHILLNELPVGIDPLGPDNILIFSNGIYTGSPIAGSGRHSVGAKSPLTDGFGEAEAGGFWGPELKKAGFDAIIIKGVANSPVYISIIDGDIKIHDATHLWGKLTAEVESKIQEELGDSHIRIAQIGVAGEKLSRIACVIFDRNRAAGRTGMGAVMGSKKLRAIAVRGTQKIEISSMESLGLIAKWMVANVDNLMGGFKKNGTSAAVMHQQQTNTLPTRNFSFGQFEGAEKIDGVTMTNTILIRRDSCFACPIQCKRVVRVDGKHSVDPLYGGPEFETLGAFGSMCAIDDLPAISKANELCNANGLDTISAGVTIAFLMECYENNLISQDELDGIDLHFGNSDGMLKILDMMIHRQGIGDLLAEGSYRAAQKIGKNSIQYVMHVKKQELAEQEPRAMHGQGLGDAVSPTGADHMHNMYDMGFVSDNSPSIKEMNTFGILEGVPVNVLDYRKVRLFKYITNWQHLKNCIGLCMFIPFNHEQLSDAINAITGWNSSIFELQKVGHRAITLARLFNLREGIDDILDVLPDRLSKELRSDVISHSGIKKEDLKKAVQMYYGMMGWSEDKGIPTKIHLLEYDLDWALPIQEKIAI
jgi:aldehyde:ferredoxin oxidoreductase